MLYGTNGCRKNLSRTSKMSHSTLMILLKIMTLLVGSTILWKTKGWRYS